MKSTHPYKHVVVAPETHTKLHIEAAKSCISVKDLVQRLIDQHIASTR